MPSIMRLLTIAPALLVVAHCQGVILKAQGAKGSPESLPLQVSTSVSDANIINLKEITDNVVNECGRTLLGGNIDIGEQTENQLLNKTVTTTTKGGKVAVTLNQVNAQGAGPYTCDIDPTGNSIGATGQTNITMQETDNKDGTTTLSLTMPADLSCTGSSAGNVCTVRCFNKAATGPFGGCFAVQQTDTKASSNKAATITTAQTLEGITAQIAVNQQDLALALKANSEAATTSDQGVDAVDELLKIDSVAAATAGAAGTAVASSAAAGATSDANGGKKGKGNGNGNANAGNGNGNGNAGKGKNSGNGKNNNNRRRGARVFIS